MNAKTAFFDNLFLIFVSVQTKTKMLKMEFAVQIEYPRFDSQNSLKNPMSSNFTTKKICKLENSTFLWLYDITHLAVSRTSPRIIFCHSSSSKFTFRFSKILNLRFQSLSKNLSCDWLMLPWWRFTGRMVRALEMTMGQKASDDADDHCQPKLLGDRLVRLYLLYCKFIHFGHFSLLSGVPKKFLTWI